MFSTNENSAHETLNFECAIATANRLKPAFVVITGDLINQGAPATNLDPGTSSHGALALLARLLISIGVATSRAFESSAIWGRGVRLQPEDMAPSILSYVALSTSMMRRAAEFWANARNAGVSTASLAVCGETRRCRFLLHIVISGHGVDRNPGIDLCFAAMQASV
jgi:hypothetical protein